MWNKLVKVIQQPGAKKLGLALLASVILHVVLMGNFNVDLPHLKSERFNIEATLQLPNPVVNHVKPALIPEQTIKPQLKTKTAQVKPKKIVVITPKLEPILQPQITQTNELNNVPKLDIAQFEEYLIEDESVESRVVEPSSDTSRQVETAQTETPEIAQLPTPEVASSDTASPDTASPDTIKQDDIGLNVNENTYVFVETDFAVYTEIGGSAKGEAKITYKLADNKEYDLKSVIKPTGLASLIISDLLQTSVGILTKNGLQPTNYLYQYGKKIDKTYIANFDWQAKQVSLITAKGNKTESITEGTQDLLSFMYQFMHVAPLQKMQISIATGKKLATYDYSFEGEEMIRTGLGALNTIHIVHAGLNSDEKTEIWLALDYQYVPIKIRKTEKNGKLYELIATAINTARPTLN